jgi:hypothetical protein
MLRDSRWRLIVGGVHMMAVDASERRGNRGIRRRSERANE